MKSRERDTGSRGGEASGDSGPVEEILERWLHDLSEEWGDDPLSEELVPSYRDLARLVLERGLADSPDPPVPDDALDGLVAAVALSNRRTGQSISSTLRRFGRLTEAMVAHLIDSGQMSENAEHALQTAMSVDAILDRSLNRLVRVLEDSSVRAREERGRAMAAVMEVLSHELDNRLGAARTAIDMLESPRIDLKGGDLERIGSLVKSSLEEAMQTVDDVEALVEAWGGTGTGSRQNLIPLPILLRRLVDELEPTAREVGVRLELASDQADRPVDAPRLRLILFNLVSNGIKYRHPGRDDARVSVESDILDDGRLRIRVEDNGIGIDPANREAIFYFRTRVGDRVQGSGLGLAIAREAVDQLGGEIRVEGEIGKGSTFTVILPDPRDDG